MDLVITLCDPQDRMQVFGYFDDSARGFSTDKRRAKSFNEIDEAWITLDQVRTRFPRIADQVDVREQTVTSTVMHGAGRLAGVDTGARITGEPPCSR
jgi:hypothetical protein